MKIFGSVALGFFTCWTPLYVYLFPKMLYPSIFIKDKSAVFVGLFYYIFPLLSTAVNPLFLITFSSNYRAALKDLFSRLFPKMSFRKRITDRKDRKASRIQSINMNNNSPKSWTCRKKALNFKGVLSALNTPGIFLVLRANVLFNITTKELKISLITKYAKFYKLFKCN